MAKENQVANGHLKTSSHSSNSVSRTLGHLHRDRPDLAARVEPVLSNATHASLFAAPVASAAQRCAISARTARDIGQHKRAPAGFCGPAITLTTIAVM
ncbi:hypothetical protein [Bradyrhizobium sp. CCGUVB23]|uniref:hypothetical protein n=1 Tax=Bradyrhizobium sp. CCGUVB23 TaxID=2949630 RepID=UPI0020B2C8AD|nr:hypothetical protein [Bradyrhizobium sp. CCGUVB23]MCP3462535.1 hypothetical protein [Bradyrhizobium sp. CCGUVB23]